MTAAPFTRMAVRTVALALATVTIATTFLGCATTGEIPVVIGSDQVIYISPANADGIQDAVTFDLLVTPLERTRLARYEATITNSAGTVVSSEAQQVPELGFFARISGRGRNAAVEPPQIVLWDGRNDAGAFAGDGTYYLSVSVTDNRGNTGAAEPREIVVDNTAPSLVLSAPYSLFTPHGDDRLDVISIYQRRSTREDLWTGEVVDAAGAVVKTFTWQGGARDFIWNGATDAGSAAAEGTYSYRVTATDLAGNAGRFELAGIILERDPRPASVSVNRPSFSPNGDGRADTIAIRPQAAITENLGSWRIGIRGVDGTTVRTFTGTGVPNPVIFDGLSDEGELIADGIYQAVLTLSYAGGQNPETASNPFVVDTTPPQATVRVSSAVFSPDGDGSKDTVQVLQSSSDEREWIGTLTDPVGTQVRTQRWTGRVGSFSWDGTDAEGSLLADGVYTYTLRATDDAENDARPIVTRVRLDTRPTPVRITPNARGFSPNGDGIQDGITLALGATVTEDIEVWSVVILDASGSELLDVAAGTAGFPQAVSWDGRVGGQVAADGEYVAEFRVVYGKGNVSNARSLPLRVDTTGPSVTATFTPALFSPDDDGVSDTLQITIRTRDMSAIQSWQADLYDPAGTRFMSWSGTGAPTTAIRWNGLSPEGELVQSAEDYQLTVSATDAVWNTGSTSTTIPIDILVIREGDRLRIRIASIYFVPFSADYVNLEPSQAQRNLETLDRLATVLRKYPQHSIRVEGHAVQVLWENPQRAAREQSEVLVPLSLARAEAIRTALVQRGIESSRMTTQGSGGALPVVPHSDLTNRWKNRRVEFILERR